MPQPPKDALFTEMSPQEVAQAIARFSDPYRVAIDAVSDYAIFLVAPSGHVLTWNPGAQRTKGYAASEIVGKHIGVFYEKGPDVAHAVQEQIRRAGKDGRYAYEGWRRRKDGSRFWADVVMTAIRNRAGELLGFVKVTRDLSERKRGEEERARLQSAEAALKARNQFLVISSAELQGPLAKLQMHLYTLMSSLEEGKPHPRERNDRFKLIRREAARLDGLVANLRQISTLLANGPALDYERVELKGLIQAVVLDSSDVLVYSGCTVDLDAPAPVFGRWDYVQLENVVTNLLRNAARQGSGKPIRIRVRAKGGVATVVIRDAGVGLTEPELAIFRETFAEALPVRNTEGFGLGLWVAAQLTRLFGGRIEVQSEIGSGTTITLHLPQEPPAKAPARD
ncbi:MAG TPA: PAS domain-containing sensor histidine kinase [Myxococcales bacterium]